MKNIKGVFRTITVMVVMLSLVCQLLPLSASAGTDALVPDAKTEESVATVSKTAERVADDKWEVTLSVEALQNLYTKPLELVILYDISGSMSWCAQEEHTHTIACRKNGCEMTEHRHSILPGRLCKGTTIEQSRQYILGTALREFVVNLNNNIDGASVSVCTFGNKGYTDVPMTELSDASVDVICDNIPVQYQNRAELTNIRRGILNAQKQFSDNPNTTKMMLILCDGEYTGSLPAVAANNLKESGVIIDCVGFLYTSDVLMNLATEGHYHYVENGIDLDVVLSSYLDITSAMIKDEMGDAVEFVQIDSVTSGECIVADDLSSWSWIPEGGVLASGETAEITYTVQLKDEYIVAGEHDIALNNSAVLECMTIDGTEYAVEFPVPLAHYEVGSLTISTEGVPADAAPAVYYDKTITDFAAKQFTFDAAAPSYTAADGTVYYYVNSIYTDKDGNTSEFDGLTTTAIDAVSGAQTIVHYYDVQPVAKEFVVSYIYGGAVPFGADLLPLPKAYAVGDTVVVADEPAEIEGYKFLGWVVLGADEADGQFTMPANHVVVKGVWAKDITPPAIKYSVSYVYTGIVPAGAPLPPSVKLYNQLTPGIKVEDVPVMDDYVFVGWFTLTAFVVDGEFTMPMNHVVFYGHWVPKVQYKVEYEYVGNVPAEADALPADAWYKPGEVVNVASTPADVEGYTFTGWKVVGAADADGAFTMPNNNVVIKGIWEKDVTPPSFKYSVSYIYTGVVPVGAPVPPAIEFYEQFTPDIAVKDVPVMDDFVFVGWFTVTAFVVDGEFTMPMNHVIFYGHWIPKAQYKVEYEYIGNVPAEADALPADAWYKANETVTVAPTPAEVEGYTFTGWFTDDASISDGTFAMPEKFVTIIGKWTKDEEPAAQYTVKYEYTGEIPENAPALPADASYEAGVGVTVAPNPAEVEGYTFTGWSTTDAVIADGAFTMPEADVVIKGEWQKVVTPPDQPEPVKYNVIYKYEGEVPENAAALPADAQYAEGADVTLAPIPADVDGYVFKGWAVADVDVAEGKFAMPAVDVTVVGVWEKAPAEIITYTVTYQDGVETVEIAVPEGKTNILAGADYTISSDIPVYEGFTFNGWISSVDGQIYNPGDTFTVNCDVILVASWSENPETSDAFVAMLLICLCACAIVTISYKAKRAR